LLLTGRTNREVEVVDDRLPLAVRRKASALARRRRHAALRTVDAAQRAGRHRLRIALRAASLRDRTAPARLIDRELDRLLAVREREAVERQRQRGVGRTRLLRERGRHPV